MAGDLILDRYWYGITERISPEAPVPVVRVRDTEERAGGAANVAANAASLGVTTTLVGGIGRDQQGDTLIELCEKHGIDTRLVRSGEATTVKLRIISQNQQLVRADFEEELREGLSAEILRVFENRVEHCDAVVISDYAKGSVTRVPSIIAAAKKAEKPVIVDPKGSDFSRYAGADLLTPNLRELSVVTGPCSTLDQIESASRRLCQELKLGAVLVTRGDAGMSLVRADDELVHFPAQARDVFDVTGAGDTVCAVLASVLAAGGDVLDAVKLSNIAAGLVVGKFGTATVSRDEIDDELSRKTEITRGILKKASLLREIRDAKRRGESIVMTNGCFDIIHAGHVRYLEEASALGDRLIVAVNDDASVSELKGSDRPINQLDSRTRVLASLAAVDWVVDFSDPTPHALIADIQPDILVKGGDYQASEISGGEEVLAAGGQVVVLEYHSGYSTSELIKRLSNTGGNGS